MDKNLGEASVLVELKDGILSVYHGTDKVKLFEKTATENSWDKLWEAIQDKK